MQIQQATHPLIDQDTCIIIGVSASFHFTPFGVDLNQQSKNSLETLVRQNLPEMRFGQSLYFPTCPGTPGKVLVICHGDNLKLTLPQYQRLLQTTATALQSITAKKIFCELTTLLVDDETMAWKSFLAASTIGAAIYRFQHCKTSSKPSQSSIEVLILATSQTLACDEAIKQATALIEGLNFCRDLANLPPNICNPSYLAEKAHELTKTSSLLSTKILEEAEMQQLGMGALLSVSQGSAQEGKLLCLDYKGSDKAPIVFIGKAVTFDSGGTSLKPSANMDEMKFDMCGGATVLALMKVVAQLQLPLHIIGLVPAVENMPGGSASRPGDIVTTLSGQTVEILNTDAEGRLILCDTLTYAERFNPELVIDIATLTGAAIMTFDHIAHCIMGNDQRLVDTLLEAASHSTDRAWELPLWDDYQEMLTSNFADIPNIAAHNNAKTIIGGCFLSRFAKKFRWAHIDIAGTAWTSGSEKGATGRPLPLLLTYLLQKTNASA